MEGERVQNVIKYDYFRPYDFEIEGAQYQLIRVSRGTICEPIPCHSHSQDSFELHFITNGFGKLYMNEKEIFLSTGVAFITGPLMPHEQRPDADIPMEEFCIYGKIIKRSKRDTRREYIDFSTPCWFGKDNQNINRYLRWLEEEITEEKMAKESALHGILENILICFLRNMQNEHVATGQMNQTYAQGLEEQRQLLIEKSFLEDYKTLTLQQLAKRLGLSERQTIRIIRESYQKTFQEKRTEARMSAAKNKLLQAENSIDIIAEEAGFATAEYFSAVFKKTIGVSPREFKRLKKEESGKRIN